MALMNLGGDYCEQQLWVVLNTTNGKGMVVIADCKREALDHVEHFLGTGSYVAKQSDTVSGPIAIGDCFKIV